MYNHMSEDDLIWTRDTSNNYYLGRNKEAPGATTYHKNTARPML